MIFKNQLLAPWGVTSNYIVTRLFIDPMVESNNNSEESGIFSKAKRLITKRLLRVEVGVS